MNLSGFFKPDIYKISVFIILLFVYFLSAYFILKNPELSKAIFFPNSWILHMAAIYLLSCAIMGYKGKGEY